MKIAFGTGLFLGGGSDEYTYEIQSISGLESPEVRNGNGVYSGADGGYWVSQYFGLRTVVIKGFSLTRCANDANKIRKYFIDRLPIRYVCPIIIEDFDNNYWYIEGCITDVKSDLTKPYAMEYQITVVCSDPLIYPAGNFTDFMPRVETYALELNGEMQNCFVAQGALYAFPKITVSGIYTTPLTITNDTTGEFITIDNTTTEGTDKTVIDIKNRAILLNGETINNLMTIDSSWFQLEQGNNHILITSGDPVNDSATAQIEYSVGFRGI